jgi:hypothetical protein
MSGGISRMLLLFFCLHFKKLHELYKAIIQL